jgi:hypothetical protein
MRHVACLVLLSAGALAEPVVVVEGNVVGPDGAPAAGVEVAPYWIRGDGTLRTQEGMTTDAEGAFKGHVRWHGRSRSLLALSADRSLGAVALVGESPEPFTMQLVPTVIVRRTFTSKGLGHPPERTLVSVTALPAIIALGGVDTKTDFSFPLPPGKYQLSVGAQDCKRTREVIDVAAGDRERDLGALDLEPTVIAQHYGKEPPAWRATDARGADPKATLADRKGKWVLLEFWGYW